MGNHRVHARQLDRSLVNAPHQRVDDPRHRRIEPRRDTRLRALGRGRRELVEEPLGLLRIAREDPTVDGSGAVESALRAAETDLDALRRLGRLLVRFGEYEAAERCIQAVLASDPTDTRFLRDLARVQQVLGRTADAAANMERYLALDPNTASDPLFYAEPETDD